MSELRWTVDIEPDQVAQLRVELGWAMSEWARQYPGNRFDLPQLSMRSPWLGAAAGALSLGITIALLCADRGRPVVYANLGFFVAVAIGALTLIAVPFVLRRYAKPARPAERAAPRPDAFVEGLARRIPLTAEYVLADGRLTSNLAGGDGAVLELERARSAQVTPHAVVVRSARGHRVLLVPAPAANHPIVRALAAAGARITHVIGPTEPCGERADLPRREFIGTSHAPSRVTMPHASPVCARPPVCRGPGARR